MPKSKNARRSFHEKQLPEGLHDELQDAEHASVKREMFARKPPTSEDDYFYEQERKGRLAFPPLAEKPLMERKPELRSKPEEIQEPFRPVVKLLERLGRLSKKTNTDWRP